MRNYIFLGAAFLALSACGQTPTASLAEAESLVAKGDLRSARIALMNLLTAEPANAKALALMARVQIASGDGVGAEQSLDLIARAGGAPDMGQRAEALLLQDRCGKVAEMAASTPANAVIARADALCAIKAGDAAGGRARLDTALTRFPVDAPLLATRARLALLEGDFALGEKFGAAAAKADSNDFDAQMVNGEVEARRGDMTAALRWFDRAQRSNPLSIAPLMARSDAYAALNDKQGLKQTVDALASLAPKSSALAVTKARLALAEGDARAAQAELLAARKVVADGPAMQQLAGEIALKLGNHDTAISELTRVVTAQPGNAAARLLLARAYAATGDNGLAADTLRPVAVRMDAPRAYVAAMARYAAAAGQSDAAAFALRAQYPSPQHIAAQLTAADTAMQRRDWRGAIRLYDALMAETGNRPNTLVLNNLGWAHFQLGQHERALELLARAAKLAPKDASVLDSYGWVLLKTGGDRVQALALLERAAALAPGNATIRQHLAEARGI